MWTCIADEAGWVAYKLQTAQTLRVSPDKVDWGTPPAVYPCLAATHMPPRPAGTDPKCYSAFVYEADCEALFAAAGRRLVSPDAPPQPTQAQFNRWTAAQLIAVVHFLVETGICKKDQFEEKLLESIELVDEYRKDRRAAAGLTSSQRTVLETLEPPA